MKEKLKEKEKEKVTKLENSRKRKRERERTSLTKTEKKKDEGDMRSTIVILLNYILTTTVLTLFYLRIVQKDIIWKI